MKVSVTKNNSNATILYDFLIANDVHPTMCIDGVENIRANLNVIKFVQQIKNT